MSNYCIIKFLLFLAFSLAVTAQTTTLTDANGHTIVQVISTNAQGQGTTRLSTFTTSTSTTTTTTSPNQPTTTTTTQLGPGPVAQPAPTTASPGAPFLYTYTTVVNGATSVVTDTFTPTTPPTVSTSIPAIGTVWAYSSWYSIYGPPSATAAAVRTTVMPWSYLWAALGGTLVFWEWSFS